MPSGTPLEVLEASDSGYTRVRTPKGNEGWVSSQYLSETPIAADRLRTANRQLEETRAELARVKEQLSNVVSERDIWKARSPLFLTVHRNSRKNYSG